MILLQLVSKIPLVLLLFPIHELINESSVKYKLLITLTIRILMIILLIIQFGSLVIWIYIILN